MDHRNSVTDDIWNRVQDRLLSANVRFVREVRRLLDLAQPEAVAAISPMLASEDIGGLQPLYTHHRAPANGHAPGQPARRPDQVARASDQNFDTLAHRQAGGLRQPNPSACCPS
jgi:hypothetical protein